MMQPPQMLTPPLPFNLTTEQIQKYLDENKQLIMAILDNQNLGKSAECASYQAHLQQNLMFLAKIADAQQPAPTIPPQMHPQSVMQQEHYMQPSQAVMSQQQQGFFMPKSPLQLNEQQLQQHTGMRSGVSSSIYQGIQSGLGNNFMNARGSKRDGSEAGSVEGFGD
ncbi:SSXT domain-containing protein [Cephalotus follicularis]|uniref:SSXT domain-containing protein n=1 Tax=Cephalotus follicularis TaxID=3775 RepID=A0A1Q3BYZ5_CEPFO|nr:SSXT domain-containing protein [Cephalotus follicularis]